MPKQNPKRSPINLEDLREAEASVRRRLEVDGFTTHELAEIAGLTLDVASKKIGELCLRGRAKYVGKRSGFTRDGRTCTKPAYRLIKQK